MLRDLASRRRLLLRGSAAAGGLALLHTPWFAHATRPPGHWAGEIIPWLDQPPPNESGGSVLNLQPSEDLTTWLTPNHKFFSVTHYNQPLLDAQAWTLEIDGLVRNPLTLTLPNLTSARRQEVAFTLECSGNHGAPWFTTAVGNAKWGGTSLASILRHAGVLDQGKEVVFWGHDSGEEVAQEVVMPQNFARSMSIEDAMNPNNILCYQMNGEPLPPVHGGPVRLIAPGWYGVANVKWLKRIEVRDRRYMGRFMARDYVTIREEDRKGGTVWAETSVSWTRLKSMPFAVVRRADQHRIIGAAWGAPIARVDVKLDDGPWVSADIERGEQEEFAWKFWSVKWPNAAAGVHAITSRAVDWQGNIQPAMDDPVITRKHTGWENNGQVTRQILIA